MVLWNSNIYFVIQPEVAQAIQGWTARGLVVTATVYGTPAWVRASRPCTPAAAGFETLCIPDAPSVYGRFAGMLAQRYTGMNGVGRIADFVSLPASTLRLDGPTHREWRQLRQPMERRRTEHSHLPDLPQDPRHSECRELHLPPHARQVASRRPASRPLHIQHVCETFLVNIGACGPQRHQSTAAKLRLRISALRPANPWFQPSRDHVASTRDFPSDFNGEHSWRLLREPADGTVMLYGCKVGQHSMLSTDSDCEGPFPWGPVSYAYHNQVGGSVPLYRCHSPSSDDHLISTVSNCEEYNVDHLLECAIQ